MVDGRRFAIPALKGYECISVPELPFGVARPSFKTYWIISPFTSAARHEMCKKTKDEFTKQIIESESFDILVAYVKQSNVPQKSDDEETIREAYRRLIEEYYDELVESVVE